MVGYGKQSISSLTATGIPSRTEIGSPGKTTCTITFFGNKGILYTPFFWISIGHENHLASLVSTYNNTTIRLSHLKINRKRTVTLWDWHFKLLCSTFLISESWFICLSSYILRIVVNEESHREWSLWRFINSSYKSFCNLCKWRACYETKQPCINVYSKWYFEWQNFMQGGVDELTEQW